PRLPSLSRSARRGEDVRTPVTGGTPAHCRTVDGDAHEKRERNRSMKLRPWLREHSLKLLAIRDTPNAIAGGVAIGIFFGFTPLVGLKTLLSIFFAWLTRCNIVAAAL